MASSEDSPQADGMEEARRCLARLNAGKARGASAKRQLTLWSQFIRARDLHRCVCCGSTNPVQAHHVVRKVLYPRGFVEPGNGISLCNPCHKEVHAEFNRRPDLSLPLDAEKGDDQDEWAYLFGRLLVDAKNRGLDQDEFYFIDDHMLRFFVKVQGYEELYSQVERRLLTRLRFAHAIWQNMPEVVYVRFFSAVLGKPGP